MIQKKKQSEAEVLKAILKRIRDENEALNKLIEGLEKQSSENKQTKAKK